jgi:hypothetical protein
MVSDQKANRKPSCTSRMVSAVRIVPTALEESVVFGLLRLTILKKFVISARNCSTYFSRIRKFRNMSRRGRLVVAGRGLMAARANGRDAREISELAHTCSDANTVGPNTAALDALAKIRETGGGGLLVVERNRLLAIVSAKDIVNFLAAKLDLGRRVDGPLPPAPRCLPSV